LAPASQAVGSAVEWIRKGGGLTTDEITSNRRFPGLQATAGLLKIAAVATILWGVMGFIGTVNTTGARWNFNPLDPAGEAMLFAIGSPLVAAMLLWAFGSLILVLLDIEAGIRRGL
jgi:hypothetical protein